MAMTDDAIQNNLRLLVKKLEEKEIPMPDVSYEMWAEGRMTLWLRGQGVDKERANNPLKMINADTSVELFARAFLYIKELPTPHERRLRAFQQSFAHLLDEARDLQLEVDFLNPLEQMMKKLSENILEDKSNEEPF